MTPRILLILLMLIPHLAYAKINITVSITPVASLISMIAGDKAEVSVIAQNQDCPHHYSLKPGDLKNAKKANLFVYINEEFDAFAKSLLDKSDALVLKISEIQGLKLVPHNWHLWLLPQNAKLIIQSAEQILSDLSPEDKEFFKNNLKRSLAQIEQLEKQRQDIMNSNAKFTLLTDSAEYLFMDTNAVVSRIYQHSEYPSIKSLNQLKEADRSSHYIISSEQDLNKFRHLLGAQASIVQLATENWQRVSGLAGLYYQKYEEMMVSLSRLK